MYQPGTDLGLELTAIELSEFAATGGVPSARAVRSAGGGLIHADERIAMSVWGFIAAETAEDVGLNGEQMVAVGTVVGRLHRVLSTHPANPVGREAGALCDLDKAMRKIDRVLDAMTSGATLDDQFRAWARDVLLWRRALLPSVGRMLEGIPPLTSQVVHGDLAMPNVLFRDGLVAAVIDFRPPSLRPVSWEISRVGCDPRCPSW